MEKKKEVQPIFIISLPRSGSTLLQRILMSHKEIESVAEPWIMLPLIYGNKKQGIYTEYNQVTCHKGIMDFIGNLPRRRKDYNSELSKFTLRLYSLQCSGNKKYFLDKTPRYYLIVEELAELFPNGKFIFLFRNPVAVMSSIMETWHNGKMRFGNNNIDLFEGPERLAKGAVKLKKKSLFISYEDLVSNPEHETERICNYLNVRCEKDMVLNFSKTKLNGRLGDVKTQKNKIQKNITPKWKKALNTNFRKRYAIRYLEFIGDKNLKIMGYEKKELEDSIRQVPARIRIFQFDRINLFFNKMYFILRPRIVNFLFRNKSD